MSSSFDVLLADRIRSSGIPPRSLPAGECQSPSSQRCRLCAAANLHYVDEVRIKNEVIREFWLHHQPGIPVDQLHPSPLGRGYRTVTKRKVVSNKKGARLGLIDPMEGGAGGMFNPVRCAIEPSEHAMIYGKIQESLEKPFAQPLAQHITYVVIKGSYQEFTLILNVRKISTPLIRAANTLSKSLTHVTEKIVGVFVLEDPSGGRYYLGSTEGKSRQVFRKIFGKGEIFQRVLGRNFLFSPRSFSQINQSLVGELVTTAGELLCLNPGMVFYDLYCGYGLFALCLAEKAGSVVGMELSTESVASAKANAERQRVSGVRFIRNDVTPESLGQAMKPMRPDDAVLLDPPRGGTGDGVIETVAAKRPGRVAHLFCNIDLMPAELRRWQSCGYRIERAIPFDMFPGTSSMEFLVALKPT